MSQRSGSGSGQLSPWDQAPYFETPYEHKEHVLSGAWTRICEHNDARIALVFQVAQATDAYISTQQPGAIQGVHLVGSNAPFELWHSMHGSLVGAAWYGQGNGAPTDITVIEVKLAKFPGEES